MMSKKIVLVGGILLAVAALFGVIAAVNPFKSLRSRVDYASAKQQAVQLLEEHNNEMTKAVDVLLNKSADEEVSIAGFSEIYVDENLGRVYFRMGAQGMLGGQYWGVLYSSDLSSTQDGEWEEGPEVDTWYVYNEQDNNFFARERLSSHWFFYYDDYDNTCHGLDWAA